MKKILVVDNSKFLASVIKSRINEQSRYDVQSVHSLEQAKELMQETSFFIVISSLTLKDAKEVQILEFLKQSSIPSIIFSTSIESAIIEDKNYPNILDYVFKDINGAIHICNLIDAISFGMGKKVLVVDDSSTAQSYFKNILSKSLLDVVCADDGMQALEFLKQNSDVALVISDMNMPIMNGLELTKAIRSNPKLAELKIIITTGQTDLQTKVNLYKYGADDVIYKPIVSEEMTYKIVKILLEQKSMQDIERFNMIADEHIISSSTNSQGIIIDASKAFCKISGYSKEELMGNSHNLLRHPDMPNTLYEDMWKTIKSKKRWQGEIKNRKKDGGYYWVYAIIEPLMENDGTVLGYYAIRQDITDKKRIEEISITDGLTDIYNRRHFNDTFPKVISSAKRANELVCFLLMDIDHFKQYNDNYGHQAGDEVLVKFAQCLKESLHRADDIAFRLGGEEFGIIYKADDRKKAFEFADSIRQKIEDLQITHQYSLVAEVITASMGLVATYASEIEDMDSVYKQADDLLYESKKNGRNRVSVNA